jgi:hypothetical protein
MSLLAIKRVTPKAKRLGSASVSGAKRPLGESSKAAQASSPVAA